jgi:hypothetical protein
MLHAQQVMLSCDTRMTDSEVLHGSHVTPDVGIVKVAS